MSARSFARRAGLQLHRLLDRGVGVRRLVGGHRRVEVGAPCPRLAPITDGAVRIALPRFAERPDRFRFREGVHHLEALIGKRLRFLIGCRDRPREGAEARLEELDGGRVAFEHRVGLRRRRLTALFLGAGMARRDQDHRRDQEQPNRPRHTPSGGQLNEKRSKSKLRRRKTRMHEKARLSI